MEIDVGAVEEQLERNPIALQKLPQIELRVIAVGAHSELGLHLLEPAIFFVFVEPFSYLQRSVKSSGF